MRLTVFILFVFTLGSVAEPLEMHEASRVLMSRKPMCLTASGRVGIPFDKACSILGREDMLIAVQKSYAAGLTEGVIPEFTIRQTAPGFYYYKNRKGRETTIEEVAVTQVAEEKITILLYSEGCRFFGEYQSLCEVEIAPVEDGSVVYTVTVHARPESALCRFFSRVTPAETYFRCKIHDMTDLIVDVCERIPMNEPKGEDHATSSF